MFTRLTYRCLSVATIFTFISQILLTLPRSQQSTSCWIRGCKWQHSTDGRERLTPLSNSSASSICEPHNLSLLAASAAAEAESRGAEDCPNSLEKRDKREWSFLNEKRSQWMPCSLENRARVLFAQTHNAKIVCVIWCQIALKRICTLPKTFHSRHFFLPTDTNYFWRQKRGWRISQVLLLYPQSLISLRHGLLPANFKFIVVFHSCFRLLTCCRYSTSAL